MGGCGQVSKTVPTKSHISAHAEKPLVVCFHAFARTSGPVPRTGTFHSPIRFTVIDREAPPRLCGKSEQAGGEKPGGIPGRGSSPKRGNEYRAADGTSHPYPRSVAQPSHGEWGSPASAYSRFSLDYRAAAAGAIGGREVVCAGVCPRSAESLCPLASAQSPPPLGWPPFSAARYLFVRRHGTTARPPFPAAQLQRNNSETYEDEGRCASACSRSA